MVGGVNQPALGASSYILTCEIPSHSSSGRPHVLSLQLCISYVPCSRLPIHILSSQRHSRTLYSGTLASSRDLGILVIYISIVLFDVFTFLFRPPSTLAYRCFPVLFVAHRQAPPFPTLQCARAGGSIPRLPNRDRKTLISTRGRKQ